ncbi:hypothetical protein K435DRAFT_585876, partial [Dendrothele bispora CBS 962.96]
VLLEWNKTFEYEHKRVVEKVQRPRCQGVCFRGKAPGSTCRFGYSHEIEQRCGFDIDSNSIIFPVLEPDINYHNPYIIVFTRHNHDLKCFLSGKAAEAAMFYISDYLEKL